MTEDHIQRKEALRWSMLLKKIKEYLEDEVEPTDEQGELVEQYDESTSDIHRGRSELAENLLNQIKTWENENVNK